VQLTEKYRPHTWPELVGLDRLKREIESIRANAGTLAGQAWWVSARSGQGKTCIARLIAAEVADKWHTQEVAGTRLNCSDLDRMRHEWRFRGLGERDGWALILNEAHGLTRRVVEDLLDFLEAIPSHCVVIFTTTKAGEEKLFDDLDDAHPLCDRCNVLSVGAKEPGLSKAFAQRAREIAQAEGLDGQPLTAYSKLAEHYRYSLRRMIGEIAKGRMAPK